MLGSCLCLRFASCWMPVLRQRPIAQHGALLEYCLRRRVPCSRACHLGSLSSIPLRQGAGVQVARAVLTALAPGAGSQKCLGARDRVKGSQLCAVLAAGSRVQGSERRPEGPASSGSVSSAPRAQTMCCWPCWHCPWGGRL